MRPAPLLGLRLLAGTLFLAAAGAARTFGVTGLATSTCLGIAVWVCCVFRGWLGHFNRHLVAAAVHPHCHPHCVGIRVSLVGRFGGATWDANFVIIANDLDRAAPPSLALAVEVVGVVVVVLGGVK